MEENNAKGLARDEGKVVYRRVELDDEGRAVQDGPTPPARQEHRLAPTLMPLLVGFALLLVLIFSLGYLSNRKLDEVSTEVLGQERQHSIKYRLTLELLVATTRLNTEARVRSRAEAGSTEDVRPLFDLRLRAARREVGDLLRKLESPPYAELEEWRKLRQDVTEFLKATEDLESYALQGFVKYRTVDDDINALLQALNREQDAIIQRREDLQGAAARRINLLTWIALLGGAIIALATILEIQRRFRQMNQSIEEARREREFSSQILQGMVSAVAALDEHDRIRSANAAFLEIFPRATVGASVHDAEMASPDALRMLEAAVASRVREATYRGRWDCSADTPECLDKTFDVYTSPLEIDGGQGQILTFVDVTAAAEAEKEVRRTESLAAVGQAAAQVAHEIKNPLGSIRLGVSMLRDTVADEDSLNTIDLVERGINHLNQLVVDVTQFSRRKTLQRTETDLHQLVEESLELVRDRILEKRTPVEKRFAEETLLGMWDPDQLKQVLVNLLANAVDASPPESPVIISIELTGGERSGKAGGDGNRLGVAVAQSARIVIEDRGAGIDEETRRRIFEPFFTTKKKGTGLGLAIVKQIVDQHDGRIDASNAPNQGTRFTLDLPLNGRS